MTINRNLETQLLKSIQAKIKEAGKRSNLDEAIATEMVEEFGKDLGIIGARIWKVKDEYTTLLSQKGGRKKLSPGMKIDTQYKPIQEALTHGICIMDKNDPGYNQDIEQKIGAENFIVIKLSPKKVLSIEVDDIEKARPALQLVKVTLDSSIKKQELEDLTQFARRVERSLLPKHELPLKEFYDIAWYSRPSKKVGGDLLVFKPTDNNSTVIAIGDARGKGISAASVTLATYFGLDVATEFNPRASILVERLNRALHNCDLTEQFISLFYSTIHRNGLISYVNAGHPYPLLFHKAYTEKLDKGGVILGPLKESKYDPGAANMQSGDLLFMYTDGLSEARNNLDQELGLEGIERIINKHRNEPASKIKCLVLKEANEFLSRRTYQDDITFAIIKKY